MEKEGLAEVEKALFIVRSCLGYQAEIMNEVT